MKVYLVGFIFLMACSLIKVETKTKDKPVYIHDTTIVYKQPIIDTFTQVHSDTVIGDLGMLIKAHNGIAIDSGVETFGTIHRALDSLVTNGKMILIRDTVTHTIYNQTAKDSMAFYRQQWHGTQNTLAAMVLKYHGYIWLSVLLYVILLGVTALCVWVIYKS